MTLRRGRWGFFCTYSFFFLILSFIIQTSAIAESSTETFSLDGILLEPYHPKDSAEEHYQPLDAKTACRIELFKLDQYSVVKLKELNVDDATFSFKGLSKGNYFIQIQAINYLAIRQKITLTDNEFVEFKLDEPMDFGSGPGPEGSKNISNPYAFGCTVVSLIFVQFQGLNTWSDAQRNSAINAATTGMQEFDEQAPPAAQFHTNVQSLGTFTVTNPVADSCSEANLWVDEILVQMGYSGGSIGERIGYLCDDQSQEICSDTPFCEECGLDSNSIVFFVTREYSSPDSIGGWNCSGTFEISYFGRSDEKVVYTHEIGHAFGANDEYCTKFLFGSYCCGHITSSWGCTNTGGCLHQTNDNCYPLCGSDCDDGAGFLDCQDGCPPENCTTHITCTMDGGSSTSFCEYSVRQMGWVDSDSDGYLDCLENDCGTLPNDPDDHPGCLSSDEFFVDAENGSDSNAGNSWGAAFATIQHAIEMCGSAQLAYPDLIHVAEGDYPETLLIPSYMTLLGGYPAGGGSRNPRSNPTEIIGSSGVRVVRVLSSNGVVVDGFTIRNGIGVQISSSTATFYNCIISHNYGAVKGGGVYCVTGAQVDLINCFVRYNDATSQGGGIYSQNSVLNLYNCAVYANTSEKGAGILCYNTDGEILNSSIVDNSASIEGGGIWCDDDPLTIENSIIWFNNPTSITSLATLDVTYSDVEQTSGTYPGVMNINADPEFVNGPYGLHYLSQIAAGQTVNSPCINKASTYPINICYDFNLDYVCFLQLTTRTDQVTDSSIADLGYHYMPSSFATSTPSRTPTITQTPTKTPTKTSTPTRTQTPTRTKTPTITPTPTITRTPTPLPRTLLVPQEYSTIQAAINAAVANDKVLVANGTYTGSGNRNLTFSGKSIRVFSQNGPNLCIIDCENSGRGVSFASGESSSALFQGFTIKNGYETGGAILCNGSNPTIANCIFESCDGRSGGGAIECLSNSSPDILNCLFTGNHTASDGGAIKCSGYSSPSIFNCTFSLNSAGDSGGALYCTDHSSPQIMSSILWNDSATGSGDEIYAQPLTSSNPETDYSDVELTEGVIPGTGNLNSNPLFFAGTYGSYYLQGAHPTSPCINAGGVNASDICFIILNGRTCLDAMTTGAIDDAGIVDMGFHYRTSSDPTNTPFPTFTPSPTPTITPTLTIAPTITQTPTVTPTGYGDTCLNVREVTSFPFCFCDDTSLYHNDHDCGAGHGGFDIVYHVVVPPDTRLRVVASADFDADYSMSTTCSSIADIACINSVAEASTPSCHDIESPDPLGGIEYAWYVSGDCYIWVDGWDIPNRGRYCLQILSNTSPVPTSTPVIFTQTPTPSPTTTPRVLHVPTQYLTIQDAIDDANDRDTVVVADGTYSISQSISFLSKQISVLSENGPFNCIIDCQDSTRAFGFNREGSSAILQGFTIRNGSASNGAAIYCYRASPIIADCVFIQNSSQDNGGAIDCFSQSSPTIINCLFFDNLSGFDGGAISCVNFSSPHITNCTFTENSARGDGDGLFCDDFSSPILYQCILWRDGTEIFTPVLSHSIPTASYCDIEKTGGFPGTGNINLDPEFMTGPGGDYYLSWRDSSPCINSGGVASSTQCFPAYPIELCLNDLTTRTDGASDSGTSDMGFHYHGDIVGPTSTPTRTPTRTPTATPTPNTGLLMGHVGFERPGVTPPHSSCSVLLSVSLCLDGSIVEAYTANSDEMGDFSVAVRPGTFNVYLKNSHSMANQATNVTIPLGGSTSIVDFGTLREGDANDDNYVISSDFFVLRATYNLAEGDPGYNDDADFNEDQMVTSTDFFLLRSHYNQQGDECGMKSLANAMPSVSLESARSIQNDSIRLAPDWDNLSTDGRLKINVMVKSPSKPIRSVDLHLNFDPSKIQVQSIAHAGDGAWIEMQNAIDNKSGTIDWAKVTFENGYVEEAIAGVIELSGYPPKSQQMFDFSFQPETRRTRVE